MTKAYETLNRPGGDGSSCCQREDAAAFGSLSNPPGTSPIAGRKP